MKPYERKIIEEHIQLLKSENEHYDRQYIPALRKQTYQDMADNFYKERKKRDERKKRNVVRLYLEKLLDREDDEPEEE